MHTLIIDIHKQHKSNHFLATHTHTHTHTHTQAHAHAYKNIHTHLLARGACIGVPVFDVDVGNVVQTCTYKQHSGDPSQRGLDPHPTHTQPPQAHCVIQPTHNHHKCTLACGLCTITKRLRPPHTHAHDHHKHTVIRDLHHHKEVKTPPHTQPPQTHYVIRASHNVALQNSAE